jgi:hypothetical protein
MCNERHEKKEKKQTHLLDCALALPMPLACLLFIVRATVAVK